MDRLKHPTFIDGTSDGHRSRGLAIHRDQGETARVVGITRRGHTDQLETRRRRRRRSSDGGGRRRARPKHAGEIPAHPLGVYRRHRISRRSRPLDQKPQAPKHQACRDGSPDCKRKQARGHEAIMIDGTPDASVIRVSARGLCTSGAFFTMQPFVRDPMTIHQRIRRSRGFTLIELMVVLVIIGVLAALIVPNVLDRTDDARKTAAKTDIASLTQALKLYKLDNLRYPSGEQGLDALVRKPQAGPVPNNWRPYLEKLPMDPWGKPYQYVNPGVKGEVDVFSLGADGQSGGEGINADIGSWQ